MELLLGDNSNHRTNQMMFEAYSKDPVLAARTADSIRFHFYTPAFKQKIKRRQERKGQKRL